MNQAEVHPMKSTGLLFTPENYTKSENGSKTQTRRIVKAEVYDDWTLGLYHPLRTNHRGEDYPDDETFGLWGDGWDIPCPYGTVGDRLYVKEGLERAGQQVAYRRDHAHVPRDFFGERHLWQWKRNTLSPLHMPQWAARLWLELTEVRVERVQDCSSDDAIAEGAKSQLQYAASWESIYGPGSWDLNEWVWVLSYKRVSP